VVVAVQEALDECSGVPQRLGPTVEEVAARRRQLIGPLGRAGQAGIPFGRDQPLPFEGPQQPVQVAEVDRALPAGQVGDALEQVVAVPRSVAEQQQDRWLDEPLDAGTDDPAPVRRPAGPGAPAGTVLRGQVPSPCL
jgi:hypothetical protein